MLAEPYYADEQVTLYRGDALAVLRELPDASVDAVVTDPPYSSGGQFRGDRDSATGSKYVISTNAPSDFTGDNRDQRAYAYWCALWLAECLRATRPGGLVMLFTDWRQLPTTTDVVQSGGWVWRGIVPWRKPNARRFAGRITNECEYVVWGSSGALPNPLTAETGPRTGFYSVLGVHASLREHQAQKPLEVMRGLASSVDGTTILDPFMGSGTTGVAAVIEHRRFVGIEMDPIHCATAERRIRTAALKAEPDPVQPDLLTDVA